MASNKSKRIQSKKWSNEPSNFPNHAFYAPNKLLEKWKAEGIPTDQIAIKLKDFIISERQKCISDVRYFLNTYGFIVTADNAGIIPFEIEDYQEELLNSFLIDKHIIVNKARQLGVSTILMFYALWLAIFSQGKRILVVAHRGENAEEFVTKLKTAYEYLPDWLKPATTVYSKKQVEFENKSVVRSMTSNPAAARSFSGSVLLVDEAAFIDDAEEVVAGIMPTIAASNGKIIAISTPNGDSELNWFYNTCINAKAKLNGWTFFEIPWFKAKKYLKNPRFKEEQIQINNGNADKFLREFECSFNSNVDGFFSKTVMKAFTVNNTILNKTFGGTTYEDTLWTWKLSEPGETYIIGVDCSANKITAKDYSAFQVINSKTFEQVAEYMGKLPTEVFVDILIDTARYYNNAQLVIEENSYSTLVFYLLDQKHYNNIWYRDENNKGFQTSKRTRPLLLEKLGLFYNNLANITLLKSKRLKIQMENFSSTTMYVDGSRKTEARKGNDDLILAMALAVVSLTPKKYINKQEVDTLNIAKDLHSSGFGEYSEDYLEYNSKRMGISVSVLENRLKMYHAIKNGEYDGTGIEELPIVHPVEEFERQQAAQKFIGISVPIGSTADVLDNNVSMLPNNRRYTFDDIFDPQVKTLIDMHQNFLSQFIKR